ncbi:hypothetical protein [uncultured Gammaproteobacteria bacterium]|nr:hypothetical protein [Bathymodiolus heckerae thiotrophic gill symbiont]CAC9583187.1 hypothetical protein [uncultured Gammaproteobacteria bacterium]
MGTGYFLNNGDTNTSKPPKSLKPTQCKQPSNSPAIPTATDDKTYQVVHYKSPWVIK